MTTGVTSTVTYTLTNSKADVYLPYIARNPTPTPRTGWWESTTGLEKFYVRDDHASIERLTIYVNVPICNPPNREVIYPGPVSIVNKQFFFTGSIYANVTFDNLFTTATGRDGLNNHVIPNCAIVSGGPWDFTATWKSATSIVLPIPRVGSGPYMVTPMLPSGKFHPVTPSR
jgi:hypothetical protein